MKKQVKAWLPDSGWSLRPLFGGMIAGLLALMHALPPAQAGLIAENEAVPASMTSTAGTANDPSVYLFDNYVKDFGGTAINVGNADGSNWVRLEIRNGAQVTSTGTNSRLGSDAAARTNEFNSCLVTGAGSSLTLAATRIGGMSPNNSLLVTDGATATFTVESFIGYNNDIRVEGEGSLIEIGYAAASALSLGESSTYCHHNTMTLIDGGVVKLTNSGGTLTIAVAPAEGGSGVRFAAGIFAVAGNRPTHLTYDKAWLWDGEAWEQAPSTWTGVYYADETEATAAGRPGFGGYTVFTGGQSMTGALKRTLMLLK